eukprot:12627174-Alexandrium_andersonii.AAC.1
MRAGFAGKWGVVFQGHALVYAGVGIGMVAAADQQHGQAELCRPRHPHEQERPAWQQEGSVRLI